MNRRRYIVSALLTGLLLMVPAAAAGEAIRDFAGRGKALIANAEKLTQGAENRFPSMPGNALMSQRLADAFKLAGEGKSGYTEYDEPVFIPGEAWLTVGGRRIRVYSFLPNLIELSNFSEKTFSGKIFYLGKGTSKELDGKNFKDSLCVFDFDSGHRYLEVMKFGARGVVFLPPIVYSPYHAYQKVLNVPFTLPRYQVEAGAADFLKAQASAPAGADYTMTAEKNRWEPRRLKNRWAFIKGSDPEKSKELMILHTNYDSMHYCPELPSSGQESLNLTAFMDMYDYYRKHPPVRSVLFMAFNSGRHYQAGAAEMITHFFGDKKQIWVDRGKANLTANQITALIDRCVDGSASEADRKQLLTLAVNGGVDAEEREVLLAWIDNAFIVQRYKKLAIETMTREALVAFRSERIKPAGKTLEYVEPMVVKLSAAIHRLEQEKLALIRTGDVAKEDPRLTKRTVEVKQLGILVTLFNKFGQQKYFDELTDDQKALFEEYRQHIITTREQWVKLAREDFARLERAHVARRLLKDIRPLMALGFYASYHTPWIDLMGMDSTSNRASYSGAWEVQWRNRGRIQRKIKADFKNWVREDVKQLARDHDLFFGEGHRDFDPEIKTISQFVMRQVPSYDFVSGYYSNRFTLSSEDNLRAVDPALAARKVGFIKAEVKRLVKADETTKFLAGKAGVPRIPTPWGAGGLIVTRVNDGASITAPTKVLDKALVLYALIRDQYELSPLTGGTFVHRLGVSDFSGRQFYYNLPYSYRFNLEVFHIDQAGRIDYATDLGIRKTRNPPHFDASNKGFIRRKLLVAIRARKADLYDVVHPQKLSPVGTPKFLRGDGGVLQRFSVSGCMYGWNSTAPGNARGFGFASIFARADQRIKVLFSGDVNLLNANKEIPLGKGYLISELDRQSVPALATRDILALNHDRITKLNKFAVTNALMESLDARSRLLMAGDAKTGLVSADTLASQHHNAKYSSRIMQGYGSALGAYPVIRSIMADMMKAVVFYLGVLLPFSFFLQKLLFTFKRIEAQIAGFAVIFLTTYAVFHTVHPAFQIAKNPQVVLIAFSMLVLGGFVSLALKGKFDYHMENMREQFLRGEEVGIVKLAGTAMLIGVNNMKRRKLRTALTCTTIVLITFTMLSFTSVSQEVQPTRIKKSDVAQYNGIYYSRQTYRGLETAKIRLLREAVGDGGDAIQRAALLTFNRPVFLIPADDFRKPLKMDGLLGLEAKEDGWLTKMPLVAGRFFSSNYAPELVVTDEFARKTLHLTLKPGVAELPETYYLLQGVRLRLVGIVDGKGMERITDLRGDSILPQERAEAAGWSRNSTQGLSDDEEVPEGTFRPVGPQSYIIVPFGMRDRFKMPTVSVSVKFPQPEAAQKVWDRVMEYVYYSTDKIYFGTQDRFIVVPGKDGQDPVREEAGRYYLGTGFETSVGGLSTLIIPLLISATIIFNTMLGAVYERKKEIAIFNAIGLNPIHIGLFFVAEAVVYGVLGGVGGYLIGQVLAKVIVEFDLLGGIDLNYSSLTVVYVILFTILITILSTIYPAIMAMRTASSSSGRRRIEKHGEDDLIVRFPYSFTREMAVAVNAYLKEYFDRHSDSSIGDFVATPISTTCTESDEAGLLVEHRYSVALAPYDLGVTQEVVLTTSLNAEVGALMIQAQALRISGQDSNWLATNQPFMNDIRKYLLHWRTLSREGQAEYLGLGLELFELGAAEKEDGSIEPESI